MWTLAGGEQSRSRSGRFIPMKESNYPLCRMLGGPQSQSRHVGRWQNLLLCPCLKPGLSSPWPTHCYLLCYPSHYQRVLLYNILFLPIWNIFMTFGADSDTHITMKASSKICLSKLMHELKITFWIIVILLVFYCYIIQGTPFTVDNWCLCLHSAKVHNVYKTYDSNIGRTALQIWWNDCINRIKFRLFRERYF